MEQTKYFLTVTTLGDDAIVTHAYTNDFTFAKDKQTLTAYTYDLWREFDRKRLTVVRVYEITEKEYYYQAAKQTFLVARLYDDRWMKLRCFKEAHAYSMKYRNLVNS